MQQVMRRLLYPSPTATATASFCSPAAASTPNTTNNKKSLVFLGSPQVSAIVLEALFDASASPHSSFQVAAIVTQPPARRDRGKKLLPSPVAQFALQRGFSPQLIFTPERASEDSFLGSLRALQPEICVTAAYGNILPRKFLNIPPLGTVNIHPSLLPLYRGAAPVQRALQDGVKETGVSLAFTVRALDSGPVIASHRVDIDNQIKAPDLLDFLFHEGSKLLVRELPSLLDGSAQKKAKPQDEGKATLAPKIMAEESWLHFNEQASVLHNKVRAFAGWPGTRAKILAIDKEGESNILELKIITTRVSDQIEIKDNNIDFIAFNRGALLIPCGGSTVLEVLEVQLPGKKVVSAAAFWNGLRGRTLKLLPQEEMCLKEKHVQSTQGLNS
ncbi:hypothetical protein MLD38_034756 [Melastoma candidum]|uniref:Uncharacterized protein n=1 Tax=Melastoma candidum TaxID=119954 RepID=A0ACB9MBH3_9MYRT|nr:hypothetical protein MLD38_034756 [Melastoma candidum]